MDLQVPGVDDMDRKLDLKNRAATAAERGAIRSQDTAFDDGQQTVIQEMGNLVAERRSTAADHLEHHQKRRGEIAAQIESFARQSFPETVAGAVDLVLRGEEETVKATQTKATRADRALRAFRLRSGIERPARYPRWLVENPLPCKLLARLVLRGQWLPRGAACGGSRGARV